MSEKKSKEKTVHSETDFSNKNTLLKDEVTQTQKSALGEANFESNSGIFVGAICPNCGARLEGRKCKLFCPTAGCGYLVTCSEW